MWQTISWGNLCCSRQNWYGGITWWTSHKSICIINITSLLAFIVVTGLKTENINCAFVIIENKKCVKMNKTVINLKCCSENVENHLMRQLVFVEGFCKCSFWTVNVNTSIILGKKWYWNVNVEMYLFSSEIVSEISPWRPGNSLSDHGVIQIMLSQPS